MLVRHLVEVKLQRGENLLLELFCWRIVATIGNAQSSETEASGRDTRDEAAIEFAGGVLIKSTIKYLPCRRLCLLDEIHAGSMLHIFKEIEIKLAQQSRRGSTC